jgi:hypothetical protein
MIVIFASTNIQLNFVYKWSTMVLPVFVVIGSTQLPETVQP